MSQSNTASQQLYDLLVARDFDPEALDAQGKPAADPGQADIISFDYRTANKNYGTVVVALDDKNNLAVYFGDNLGRAMEAEDRGDWYDFLYLLRMFAKRNLLSFELQNLSRLKFNMKTMAAVKESLFESFYGTRRVSYSDQPQKTRLKIRHSRELDEGEARHHAIESLFVETADGEVFRVPSRSLMHGRMLARHVAEGGTPYDAFGQHIAEIMTEMVTLAKFIRAARHRHSDGAAGHMVESAVRHYTDLKAKAKRMISRRGYHETRDAYDPTEITTTNETVETIRELFVQQILDPRVEQALPVLARMPQDMAEADMFEQWTHQVTEGTWALPDSAEKRQRLQALMSKDLVVGPDATNAQEQLYDLIGDDELFDTLTNMAITDPDANVWSNTQVQQRMQALGIRMPDMTQSVNIDKNSQPRPA